MKNTTFAIKADFVYSAEDKKLVSRQNSYLVCKDGLVEGIFATLPDCFKGILVLDKTGSLVIPGLVDLHLHAPQYSFRSIGMDLELLEWLNTRTFPEEAKYASVDYAKRAYGYFVIDLVKSATTRACMFATAHVPATLLLMDMLDETGLISQVGKVNMDSNATKELQEESAEKSLSDTALWLEECKGRHSRTTPILTPRFIPSCSRPLLQGLSSLQKRTGLAVQSHLSENMAEIAWVKQLYPECQNYAQAYHFHNLLGGQNQPTIMAHCVHTKAEEMALLKRQNVWVAHCPTSNSCLSSGIAPLRDFLKNGLFVGLGSDIAGGYTLSIFNVMADAIKDSKLRWRLEDNSLAPLTAAEAFYLGTRGGGGFFGKVGAFEKGFEFDALVMDESTLPCPFSLSLEERLERLIYLANDQNVAEKYVRGRRVK